MYSTSFEYVDDAVWGYCKQILNTNGKQLMCLSVFDDMLRRESERERERFIGTNVILIGTNGFSTHILGGRCQFSHFLYK